MKYQYLLFEREAWDENKDSVWYALAAPKGWPPVGYRLIWRFLVAMGTLPWWMIGDRLGWHWIGRADYEDHIQQLCQKHARENDKGDFYDPYPVLLEEDLAESEKLVDKSFDF